MSFRTRDEQEVAGYADVMELVFEAWRDMPLTENHLKQFHGALLKSSDKDERHRGQYKTLSNQVEAFDEAGRSGVSAAHFAPREGKPWERWRAFSRA